MKKVIAMFVFIFFATTVSTSITAACTGEKKATKSAAHKHNDKKDGCGMKNMSEGKKGDCCKMDSKNDSEKEVKEETKKESEKK